jgi:hypothetical protein
MKPLTLTLIAAAAVASRTELSDAFTPNLFSSREERIHRSSSSFHTTTGNPSRVVMNSSPFDSAAPNDQVVREEYGKWRQKYYKGEFDAYRYENFKANFMAVTVRNNMERTRAAQNGEAAPSPIALNEFGDCSADEYRMAMGQQQQQQQSRSSGPRRVAASANNRPAAANKPLQPGNTIINTSSTSSNSNNNRNSRTGSAGLAANASEQLRAAVQHRSSMESELVEMKRLLEEKKKLLVNASKEEQTCQERLVLREEQKRLLNDRLNNGWEDEQMNNYY